MTMPQNVDVKVQGNFSGNIVVGNHNIVVNNPNGGVVNIVAPPAKDEPRTRPVSLRPRNFQGLLDRTLETENFLTAVKTSMPVTVFGESGIGKTSLLRKVAHLPEADAFKDGVVYLSTREVARDDLLQNLYDSFFVSRAEHKPTDGEIRAKLNDLQSMVILDDVTLSREDAASILDVMPKSLFVISSTERLLWGEGQSISLDGLPEGESLQLFERELGRGLTPEERPIALQICIILLTHPLRILQTASMIREDGLSIPQAFQTLTTTRTQAPTVEMAVQKSNDTQKKIFSLLAVAGGFALTREHVLRLIPAAGFDADLKALVGQGLVQDAGRRLSLSTDASAALSKMWDLSAWEDTLTNYFVDWLKTGPQDMLVDQVADLLFHLMKRTGEKKQWPKLVALGKTLERLSILQKKWQRWVQILELLRMAARALADKKLEGWVLHQLGTRAMCMGTKVEAQTFLKQALEIRRAIGDTGGIKVTQHNLNILLNPPVVKKTAQSVRSSSGVMRWLLIAVVGGGAAVILSITTLAIVLFARGGEESTPIPPTITESPTVLPPTFTFTPLIPTGTDIPTRVVTFTPSPTPVPVILFDFVARANTALWENTRNADTSEEQTETILFPTISPVYEPEYYVDELEEPYVGWEKAPRLEDASKDSLALLAYPRPSNSRLRGTYDLSNIILRDGDVLKLKVGHRFPDSEFPSDFDGLIFVVSFYDTSPDKIIYITEIRDYYDGTTNELTFPIPEGLYGRQGWFLLDVYTNEVLSYDWAVWIDAVLMGTPR
ncbi:MAG: ATP-binding protein [Anaerolineae bacterium]|nr:ATP-binding protein [Anaerolineae bacterium]